MTEDQWPVKREGNEEHVVSGRLSAGKLKEVGGGGGRARGCEQENGTWN